MYGSDVAKQKSTVCTVSIGMGMEIADVCARNFYGASVKINDGSYYVWARMSKRFVNVNDDTNGSCVYACA